MTFASNVYVPGQQPQQGGQQKQQQPPVVQGIPVVPVVQGKPAPVQPLAFKAYKPPAPAPHVMEGKPVKKQKTSSVPAPAPTPVAPAPLAKPEPALASEAAAETEAKPPSSKAEEPEAAATSTTKPYPKPPPFKAYPAPPPFDANASKPSGSTKPSSNSTSTAHDDGPATFGGSNLASFKLEFAKLDADGSGFVEPDEVSKLFLGFLPKPLLERVISFVDTNKDGKIDFDEYTKIRQQLAAMNIGKK